MIKHLLPLLVFFFACGGSVGPPRGPFQVAGGGMRRFPFSYDLPDGGVLVSHSTHKDDYLAHPVDEVVRLGFAPQREADFYLSGLAPVLGGLYAASYITYAKGSLTEEVRGWFSGDGGRTWAPRLGVLHLSEPPIARPAGWAGLLLHRRFHRVGDKLSGTAYGGYARDARPEGGEWYRSVWVESADEGANWTVRSTIAEGRAGTEGYAEPVSTACPDGRILVVMRTGPISPMRYSRSSDGGITWSPPKDLLGMVGWDPDLLVSGSDLYLSWGVTGEFHLAVSSDCGDSWTRLQDFDVATTSGYTGLTQNGGLTVFADRAGETEIWGYPVTK